MRRTSIGVLLLMISFVLISFSSCKSSQPAASDNQVSVDNTSTEPAEKENVVEQTYVVPKETYTRVNKDFNELAELSETFFYDKINDKIEEIYSYFESKETPVLTVVTFSGDRPVFDRPMTIEQYLNYLKDKKTFNLKIYEITVNKDEKITKLVLSK
ncbi:hypothetical protein OO013_00300 [Mangrovivirga sp. M17]|uniref:Uncharacterized protein n=1 Tax=Mangrovivirga halotolerans TaxID=2993936 RepID=A0ABT3RL98_9BACT|nr:hypothetical protein [Mangrovivirga halotolerans]MCX2742278.1 hypothetical protein [Mangrovivirga halotolerans]